MTMTGEVRYAQLWKTFWSDEPQYDSINPEPSNLAKHIKTIEVNDSWLTGLESNTPSPLPLLPGEDAAAAAADGDEDEAPASTHKIRYIDLSNTIQTAFRHLSMDLTTPETKPAFIVREEYVEFFEHALKSAKAGKRRRYFVTGQPGIGKTYFSYYTICRVVATGISVFLIKEPPFAYYFSSEGVKKYSLVDLDASIEDLLESSWVVVDFEPEWTLPEVLSNPRCLIWTSPPRKSRMDYMEKKFAADVWYMRAWSTPEIAAATTLRGLNHAAVFEAYELYGPVARDLLRIEEVDKQPEEVQIRAIKNQIRNIIAQRNRFAITEDSHELFLIQPQQLLKDKKCFWERSNYEAEFRSDRIAQLFAEEAQNHWEENFAAVYNTSASRLIAGKLFETIIHSSIC
ncbi:Crinkler (CRN) family protein [Mycena indigotica]|uniref:Crinkler (CRN) family protein n=1 Tax=Mycena indigotica TaxID=2126181 RepID=A0A8H6SLB0_9AGAR|nr:Crinkler (CRN) family protein [Mycena indigotica]KAF7301506.1 Crinkler (CRN) family protein [Mycena indigotica]